MLLMVRPAAFGHNPQTAGSNAFQQGASTQHPDAQASALLEFDQMVQQLRAARIPLAILQDTPDPPCPDAIFPNNWFSCPPGGPLVLYSMLTPNRRAERRPAHIQEIQRISGRGEVMDLTPWEDAGAFLEGTGSMVMHHAHRLAFGCISPRTQEHALQRACALLGYTAIPFVANDPAGQPIYHTNVVMAIGCKWAVLCEESIIPHHRASVRAALHTQEIIPITQQQMASFCGNLLEVTDEDGNPHILMSQTAHQAFTQEQLDALTRHASLLVIPIPTIEQVGGGSVRCMVAEIFS